MTLSSIYGQLEKGAKLSPDSVAILAPKRAPLTFSRLLAQAREVVTRLNALGIHRNDRVAIVLPNGPEMAAAFLSIACGAAAAPLNPAYGASEFDFYMSDLEAKALVIQVGVTSPSVEVAQARGIPVIEIEPKLEGPAGLFCLPGAGSRPGSSPRIAGAEDTALVLHTSGTTSRPKINTVHLDYPYAFCSLDSSVVRSVAWAQGEVAHLALDATGMSSPSARHHPFL